MRLSRSLAIAALAFGTMLAGCSSEPLRPDAIYIPPKQVRVEWRVDQHPVVFPIGSDQPLPGQLAALDQFIAAHSDEGDIQIFIDADPAVVGRELAARRYARLQSYIAARGFSARPAERDAAAMATEPDPRRATVYIGRFVALAPACPDWRKPTASDFTNTPSSNFGCATAVNFSQMIANPGELLRGQTMGPADGERAARAIRRYREGEKEQQSNGAGATGMGITTTGGGQ